MDRSRLSLVRSTLIALVLLCCSATAQAQAQNKALWLVTDNASHTELAMRPIDPDTLQDLPNHQPIVMGHHYITALNAEQTLMAAILWPSGYNTGGVLHLIDLTAWHNQTTATTFNDYATAFSFSADGKSLSWLAPTKTDPTHGVPRDYDLFACETVHCVAPTQIVALPSDFMVQAAAWFDSDSQLAIFGIPTDTNFVVNGTPRIIFVDLAQRKITATLILEGLNAGQHPVKDAANNKITHYEDNQPGLAWDLKAMLLYIVHPTEAVITAVDLRKHAIKQQVNLSTSNGTMYAKGMQSGTRRLALLDPSGRYLYMSSYVSTIIPMVDGKFTMKAAPGGIHRIDTWQMQQVQYADLPLFEMGLSPDGRYLVGTGITRQQPSEGTGILTLHGLYILEASTFEVLRHVEMDDTWVYLHGFSLDSRYVYVGLDKIEPGPIPPTLNVIDLPTQEYIHKRPLPVGHSQLFGAQNPLKW
jgi:hypothetical protein